MAGYTVILADETTLSNLELNGNNFIYDGNLSENIFSNNLSPVTIINSDGTEEVHEHMELIQIQRIRGLWWFILNDVPSDKLQLARMRSDVDYIAMMTDVDLEEM